jgi:brefeldin A-inhibited guanine nucleotide-exchange protein
VTSRGPPLMATTDIEPAESAQQSSSPAEFEVAPSSPPAPTRPAENGHDVDEGQDAEDPGAQDDAQVARETVSLPDRSKVLPSPSGDEEPSTPIPPTPSTKRLPTRTDSLRSSASHSPVVSPRALPTSLAFANQVNVPNGRDSPSLAPPTPGSASHRRSLTISRGKTVSSGLISPALETIAASKEAKRAGPLKDSVQNALELVRAGEGGDRPREIFEPLRLACETNNEKLMVASLDCISKLISYSFFLESSSDGQRPASPVSPSIQVPSGGVSTESIMPPSLVDLVVHTVTSCHTEHTTDPVSLQIVKALLSLVLSSTLLVHQSSLLKTIRTVWNVFLLSNDPVTQTVAQGGLTQMAHHIFTRCHVESSEESDDQGSMVSLGSISSDKASLSTTNLDTVSVTPSTPTGDATPPTSAHSATRGIETDEDHLNGREADTVSVQDSVTVSE